MKLILASQSPRRLYYLRRIGIEPIVIPADVDESTELLDPEAAAVQVAERKVRRAAELAAESGVTADLIVGADTCVVIDGHIIGKPHDQAEAASMLERLSGRSHLVVTGLAVMRVDDGVLATHAERTVVHFNELTPAEIDAYVITGEPMDKAGAYGIQERGALFVSSVQGCFYNVAGMPLSALGRIVAGLGYPMWRLW